MAGGGVGSSRVKEKEPGANPDSALKAAHPRAGLGSFCSSEPRFPDLQDQGDIPKARLDSSEYFDHQQNKNSNKGARNVKVFGKGGSSIKSTVKGIPSEP